MHMATTKLARRRALNDLLIAVASTNGSPNMAHMPDTGGEALYSSS